LFLLFYIYAELKKRRGMNTA